MSTRKRIIGGPPIQIYILKNSQQYPELPLLQQEVAQFYDNVYCQQVPLEKASDLQTAITSPEKSIVLVLTKKVMINNQLKGPLNIFKSRNVKTIMYPISILPDPYYYVASGWEDVHRIIWAVKKTLGGEQLPNSMVHAPITTIPGLPNQPIVSNFGLPSMPLSQSKLQKLNKLPIYLLKSANEEFDQIAQGMMMKYQNNPFVQVRQIKSLNQFSQRNFSAVEQPILIVSCSEANQIATQLNMFRMSSQTKVRTVLYKTQSDPIVKTEQNYTLATSSDNEINNYISAAVAGAGTTSGISQTIRQSNPLLMDQSLRSLQQPTGQSQARSLNRYPGSVNPDNYPNRANQGMPQRGDIPLNSPHNNKIQMMSTRKISPAQVALTGQAESVFMVLGGGSQQFQSFYRSLPFVATVIKQVPANLNEGGKRVVILAPYQFRQPVIRSLSSRPQNASVVFYCAGQMTPDTIIKHHLIDLITNNKEEVVDYLRLQNIKPPTNPNRPVSSVSGINSVINPHQSLQQRAPTNMKTLQWYTRPTGPGAFLTVSNEGLQTMPNKDIQAYQRQTINPNPFLGKQQLQLRYPAVISQMTPFQHNPERQIADALDHFMRQIKAQQVNRGVMVQPSYISNRSMMQEEQIVIGPNRQSAIRGLGSSLISNPEVKQITQSRATIKVFTEPQPNKFNPVLNVSPAIPMGALVPPYQVNTEKSYEQSDNQRKNTARFKNSLAGHPEWSSGRESLEYFQLPNNEKSLPINDQRPMSFKHPSLSSKFQQKITYESKMPPAGAKPGILLNNPLGRSNANQNCMFNYQHAGQTQWHAFRNPSIPGEFLCCNAQNYQRLSPQEKFIQPGQSASHSNQLMLQSANLRNRGVSSRLNPGEIPTVSKMSRTQVPLPGTNLGIDKMIANAAESVVRESRNMFTYDSSRGQMEWHAAKKNNQPNYVTLASNQYNQNRQLFAQQTRTGLAQNYRPQSLSQNRNQSNMRNRKTQTIGQQQSIQHNINDKRGGSSLAPMIYNTRDSPLFPIFNGPIQARTGHHTQNPSAATNDKDKQIAAMIFNSNNFRQQNYQDQFEDFEQKDQIEFIANSGQEKNRYTNARVASPTTNKEIQISQHKPWQVAPNDIEQVTYTKNRVQQFKTNSDLKRLPSPSRDNMPTNLRIQISPSPPEFLNDNWLSQKSPGQYQTRQRKPPQVARQVVQVISTPQQNRPLTSMVNNFPPKPSMMDQYQGQYRKQTPTNKRQGQGSIAQTIVNRLRQSKSLGSGEFVVSPTNQPSLGGSRSIKRGITNTVIEDNLVGQVYSGQKMNAGKFQARNDHGVLIYSRKQPRAQLSPKVESARSQLSPNGRSPIMDRFLEGVDNNPNILASPTRDFGEYPQQNNKHRWGQTNNNQIMTNYSTIMNKINDQPIQIIFKRSSDFLQQVSSGFEHPPYKLQRFLSDAQLQQISRHLAPQLMTVLVTDEVPSQVERLFHHFSNFNCVMVPKDKLYKAQQARHPGYKWIVQENSTTVIYKIRDYLNRYNYLSQLPVTNYRSAYQPARPAPKHVNILMSESLRNKVPLESTVVYKTFLPGQVGTVLDANRVNLIIVQQDEVQFIQRVVSPNDKILVLQKQNQISLHTSPAELSTKNPAAIVGYITRLLQESGAAKTPPHVLYYFDQIELQEAIERKSNGRYTLIRYHDERSLLRKVGENLGNPMVVILSRSFSGLVKELRRISMNLQIVAYRAQSVEPGVVDAKSSGQVLQELSRFD